MYSNFKPMEIKDYLKILRKHLGMIIIITLLFGLFAYVFTLKQDVTYEASGNLTVVPKPTVELKNVYEYGGYYALQAASLFINTIAFWLQSPEIVAEIYKKAGYEIEKGQTSRSLSKLIKTTILPNSFSLKFQLKNKDKTRAEKLAIAVGVVVQEKVAEFDQKTTSKDKFEVLTPHPNIVEIRPKKAFNTAVGALAGLVFGVFLVFVIEYFRKS